MRAGKRSIPAKGALNLGAINAAQKDKAVVFFRLLPLIRQGINDYFRDDALEVNALFVFHGATPRGSSAEPFYFDPDSGTLKFKGVDLTYLLVGLLGVKPRDHKVEFLLNGEPRKLTYGEVIDVMAADIKVSAAHGSFTTDPRLRSEREDRVRAVEERNYRRMESGRSSEFSQLYYGLPA